ncbi:MAG TPA: sugar phosphate isomerase/epimerase family protein [Terriglobia bacterium]|nr:sugar phosphate isomerase/epimerase family protein [Terriglobia bacterium]
MSQQIQRRKFLKVAGAAATAATAGLAGGSAILAAQSDGAPQTAGSQAKMPRMFSGCCAYSFRKYLQHGPMTMEDFIRKGVELKLDGVDMTGYYFKSTDPGYLGGLRHFAYKHGVPFSGAACGVSLVQADPDRRAQSLVEVKKWVDAADLLGASHLRVFAGKLPQGATIPQAIGWVVETLKAAADYSGGKGIMLGLEDHSGITQNADACLEIMHRVDSPYAGINLDITHFIPTATQDAYAQIAACITYATNTHIRDVFDDQTPIDMDRVWGMFAQAGFKGYMSAEYEGHEDPMTGVPKLTAKIRNLCKKYSTV